MISRKTYLASLIILSSCAFDIEAQEQSKPVEVKQSISSGDMDVVLENAQALDHEAMKLGIVCSAHTYNLKLSDDVYDALKVLDRDMSLEEVSNPDVKVIPSSANSTVKCIMIKSTQGKCQANLNITGKLVSISGQQKPFDISKEAVELTTACEGATKALRKVSLDAVSELATKAKAYEK